MADLAPQPRVRESRWRKTPVKNLLAGMEVFGLPAYNFGPDAWVVHAAHLSEFMAPLSGYAVVFPTATDCLYWFRWHVIPATLHDLTLDEMIPEIVVLTGEPLTLALAIDACSTGVSSIEVLNTFWSRLVALDVSEFEIYFAKDVHSYLDLYWEAATLANFLQKPVQRTPGGRWSMTSAAWNKVSIAFTENGGCGFDGINHSNGRDPNDNTKSS